MLLGLCDASFDLAGLMRSCLFCLATFLTLPVLSKCLGLFVAAPPQQLPPPPPPRDSHYFIIETNTDKYPTMDYDDFCQLRSSSASSLPPAHRSASRRNSSSSSIASQSLDCSEHSCSGRIEHFASPTTPSKYRSRLSSLANGGGRRRLSGGSSGGGAFGGLGSNKFRKSYLKNRQDQKDKTSRRRNFISDRLSSVLGDTENDAMALLVCKEFEELDI